MIIPGGAIPDPTISPVLLIDVSIRPRMSFYLDGEGEASLIVDAKVTFVLVMTALYLAYQYFRLRIYTANHTVALIKRF